MGRGLRIGWALPLLLAAAHAAAIPPGMALVHVRVAGYRLLPEDRQQTECCLVDGPFRSLYKIEAIYAGKVHGRRMTGPKYYASPTRPGLTFFALVQDTGGPEPEIVTRSGFDVGACFAPDDAREHGIEAEVKQLQRTYPCRLRLTADGQTYEPAAPPQADARN